MSYINRFSFKKVLYRKTIRLTNTTTYLCTFPPFLRLMASAWVIVTGFESPARPIRRLDDPGWIIRIMILFTMNFRNSWLSFCSYNLKSSGLLRNTLWILKMALRACSRLNPLMAVRCFSEASSARPPSSPATPPVRIWAEFCLLPRWTLSVLLFTFELSQLSPLIVL